MTATPGADVFLSYASSDRRQAEELADRLTAAGVGVWIDRRGIAGGTSWAEEIVRAVRGCKVLLLLCSDDSMRSWPVKQEVQLAGEARKVLLPVMLTSTSFPEQMEFFLAGCQWIEARGRPEEWMPSILRALAQAGILGGSAAGPPPRPLEWGLEGLRRLASFTDQFWPARAEQVPSGAKRTLRDLGAAQDGQERGFHLGSRMKLVLEVDRPAHLLLIDQGTTGTVYCLCPSSLAPNTAMTAGRNILPQPEAGVDAFILSGRPGREELLALLTDEPLLLDWKPRDPRTPARVLGSGDVELLLSHLHDRPGRWTALATWFDVYA